MEAYLTRMASLGVRTKDVVGSNADVHQGYPLLVQSLLELLRSQVST